MKLEQRKGRTLTINSIAYTDTDTEANLTGGTIKVMAKKNMNDPDSAALFTKLVGSGIVVTDAVHGRFTTTITAQDTNDLAYDKIFLEIVAKLSDGSFIPSDIIDLILTNNVLKTLY